MKKLTMNRLSLAGIRANRKDMTVLILSVFLAVFFTVGTLLGRMLFTSGAELSLPPNMAQRMLFSLPQRLPRRT